MKIALLVTGPQGVRGGAEALCDGLEPAIQEAGHYVERIDIRCDESTFEGILEGYARAREMDLSRFDAVVSTKAPTYAVRHPRHVAYLVHTVRVFYDMFDSWNVGRTDGCFQRDRIRELDYEAFASIPEERRFAIGEEVAGRLWRAIGLKATVIHPALLDSGRFHQGLFEHFLHVGRLHEWKRADFVVRAFRRARSEMPLLIAGTGPEEGRLRELAGDDPRIRFLGHVSRSKLIELYARALAVPFVPIREDFGYITIEAMLSGKPVITASDSGEAVRLVTETGAGLVVDPEPDKLAAAMDRLAASTDEARSLGARGIERARRINWPEIVGTLLRPLADPPRASGRPEKRKTRLLVVDSQPIEPPVGGGRLRLWGLYSHLPDDIEPRYVGTYDWPGPGYRTVTHNGRLLEITVPQSREHFAAHDELLRREPKLTVDVTFPRLSHLSTAFVRRVRDEARWADVIVLSHPWVYPHLRGRPEIAGKPLFYDAQNVEGFLKRSMLSTGGLAGEIAAEIESLEARVCQDADVVLACSNEDARLFSYLYDVPPAKLVLIPNGVDTDRIRPAKIEERAAARARFDLAPGHVVVLFVGSAYLPNIDAARFICTELAPLCPDFRFLLVGGCGDRLKDLPIPSNVLVTGRVDDATRNAAYAAADIALNPMRTGGGTNIKMLDYLSAGLPVVSTPLGARGLDPADNPAILGVPLKGFAGAVRELVADPERRRSLARTARRIAEGRYDWRQISNGISDAVRERVRKTRPLPAPVPAAPQRARKPFRLAIMSTWETRCGIADYTGFLARSLPPSVEWKIYAEETRCGVPDGSRVRRNWRYGLPDIAPLRESLRRDRPDFLLVQHNPGFFREDGIGKLADLRDDVGVPIGITLHAGQGLRMTPPVARDLARFDRVFVHRPSDAGWLRDRGFTGNVDVFHHGIQEFPDRTIDASRALTGLPDASFVVGHFGYLRPHKGTLELIEAFDILAPHFPALRLLLLCSEYPSPDSVTYRSICDRRVAASPFRGRIDVDFRHLPIDQVALLLQACDLIALPYWPTRESSSAAVRTAVSARRPILVSNSNIFEDIADCAEVSADCSPHPLADAIEHLILDTNLLHRAAERVRSLARDSAWRHVAMALSSDLILSVARTRTAIGENPCRDTSP
jgi:glycosyltransferase involved in cell wall biosynthesis